MSEYTVKHARLIKTMERFFKQRHKDRVSLSNGELPPRQKKIMDSVIKQALAISEDSHD